MFRLWNSLSVCVLFLHLVIALQVLFPLFIVKFIKIIQLAVCSVSICYGLIHFSVKFYVCFKNNADFSLQPLLNIFFFLSILFSYLFIITSFFVWFSQCITFINIYWPNCMISCVCVSSSPFFIVRSKFFTFFSIFVTHVCMLLWLSVFSISINYSEKKQTNKTIVS